MSTIKRLQGSWHLLQLTLLGLCLQVESKQSVTSAVFLHEGQVLASAGRSYLHHTTACHAAAEAEASPVVSCLWFDHAAMEQLSTCVLQTQHQ